MTNEVNEMSAASRGSQPVAWAVVQSECWSVYLTRLDANRAATHGLGELVPLYRKPQLTLTDAERLLIQSAAEEWEEHAQHWRDNDERVADESDSNAATLRGLLERTQPLGNSE
jgi:hypothetical protein